jgi:hypothetical protein
VSGLVKYSEWMKLSRLETSKQDMTSMTGGPVSSTEKPMHKFTCSCYTFHEKIPLMYCAYLARIYLLSS